MSPASPPNPEETIFARVRALPAAARASHLDEACGGDIALRQRMEELLRADESAGFMASPVAGLAAIARVALPSEDTPRKLPDRYKLGQKIGSGSMGEVYEAKDTQLHRLVAVKILPLTLASQPQTLERFKQEARALAALNHPNIVTIYSVEEFENSHFITMERVTGRRLTELIPKAGFDGEEFLSLAIPLTDALAAAHARGIGHRDIKPSNVMVNDQGRLKVIDFGLAKLFEPTNEAVDIAAAKVHDTVAGQILGTPAYMSPEQIEGRKTDHRSDIFSLGILFCEMATAQRPFTGDTSVSIMSSILRDAPMSLGDLKPGWPERLERIVERCLQKDPNNRYQSALDVRNELSGLKEGAGISLSSDSSGRNGQLLAVARLSPGRSAVRPNNLPLQLTSFVGRERETTEVINQIAGDPGGETAGLRLLTLTGAGGTGKTRLALEVALGLVERFPDGVWLVEFAALSDPSLVIQTAATAVGLRHESSRPPLELLVRFLERKRTLLLLDNCEHLVAACAELADVLLRACPPLQILVTSREGLRLAGETIWQVPTLSVPSLALGQNGTRSPDALRHYESIKLFVERARAITPTFALNEQNAAAVAELCHRLDGIPLAIELAAARTRLLPLDQLLERVHDRFRLLTGGTRTALPRQQTLRATVDWSYELLSVQERILFNRLSVFAGGWTLEAAEKVCADDEPERKFGEPGPPELLPSSCILDLLGHLLEKSMIMAESSVDGSSRFRMLETLRQYAQERLAAQSGGATDALRARHTNYYITLGEKVALEMFGPDQPKWSERLDVEHDNIRAGLDWGKAADASPERVELVLRLAAPLFLAWFRLGYGREERQHFEALLAHPNGRRPTRARAQVLYAAGSLTFWQDGDSGASPQLDESLAMAEFLGDTRVMANARHSLGVVSYFRGDLAGARRHHEEALRLTRADGDLSGIRISLEDLSDVTADEGDPVRAAELQEEAFALARRTGDQHGMASVLQSMGSLASATGKPGRARELMGEGLNIMQRIGCLNCSARYLGDLASIASSSGEPDRAGRLLGAADALRERTGIVMRANAAGALEKTMAKTMQQLGETAFSNAWNEGRAMSLVQVSAYAMGVSSPPPPSSAGDG